MRGRGLAGMHGLMRTGVCVALSARGSKVLTEGQGYIGGWGISRDMETWAGLTRGQNAPTLKSYKGSGMYKASLLLLLTKAQKSNNPHCIVKSKNTLKGSL